MPNIIELENKICAFSLHKFYNVWHTVNWYNGPFERKKRKPGTPAPEMRKAGSPALKKRLTGPVPVLSIS